MTDENSWLFRNRLRMFILAFAIGFPGVVLLGAWSMSEGVWSILLSLWGFTKELLVSLLETVSLLLGMAGLLFGVLVVGAMIMNTLDILIEFVSTKIFNR